MELRKEMREGYYKMIKSKQMGRVRKINRNFERIFKEVLNI